MEHIQQFKNSMMDAGFMPPNEIVIDGKIHRFSTNNHCTDNAGWYVLHAGRFLAGCFGDWRSGKTSNWCAKPKDQMSLTERVENLRLIAKAREQRNQFIKQQQKLALSKAQYLWDLAIPALDCHPYLQKKRISPFNVRQRGDMLLLPIVNFEGELQSLQFIDPTGCKRLLSGGAKKGHFILVNGVLGNGSLCICEGFATGASIAAASPDKCVIAAIDAGNLEPVALGARRRWPHLEILICADDDRLTPDNPGLTKARHAAIAAGASYTSPLWPDDAPDSLTDFNDLANWIASRIKRKA